MGQGERNYPGSESLWGRKKTLTMSQVHSSTADLLPKDLRFEHGALNLLLALGAIQPRYAPGRCMRERQEQTYS